MSYKTFITKRNINVITDLWLILKLYELSYFLYLVLLWKVDLRKITEVVNKAKVKLILQNKNLSSNS